jgi:hypothetical protein
LGSAEWSCAQIAGGCGRTDSSGVPESRRYIRAEIDAGQGMPPVHVHREYPLATVRANSASRDGRQR